MTSLNDAGTELMCVPTLFKFMYIKCLCLENVHSFMPESALSMSLLYLLHSLDVASQSCFIVTISALHLAGETY